MLILPKQLSTILLRRKHKHWQPYPQLFLLLWSVFLVYSQEILHNCKTQLKPQIRKLFVKSKRQMSETKTQNRMRHKQSENYSSLGEL